MLLAPECGGTIHNLYQPLINSSVHRQTVLGGLDFAAESCILLVAPPPVYSRHFFPSSGFCKYYVLCSYQKSVFQYLCFRFLVPFLGGAGKNGVSSQPENLKSDSQESEELKSRESKPPMCLQSLKQFKTAGLEALLKLQAWK